LKSRHVLAALALCVAAILLLSDRPWHLYGLPGVDEVATLPDTPDFADVRRYTEVGSGLLPHWPGADIPDATARPVMKLGWFHTEYGLARMPFWASSDPGWVAYFDLPRGRQVAILGPTQVDMIEQRLGTRFTDEYAFPWYRKMWGWLVVAGLLGWTLLKRRETRIAEDERWAA
jgi:hypothetical protein